MPMYMQMHLSGCDANLSGSDSIPGRELRRLSCRMLHDGADRAALTRALDAHPDPDPRDCTLTQVGDSFSITRIDLETTAEVPGLDDATFQRHARDAKQNCPVSKALAGTEIRLIAKLLP